MFSPKDNPSNLPSTFNGTWNAASQIITLTGTHTFAAHERTFDAVCNTNFNQTGANLKASVETILQEPGPRPHCNDARKHPETGVPLTGPGSRMYEQKDLTESQKLSDAAGTLDHNTRELTPSAQRALDNAQLEHDKFAEQLKKERKEIRTDDTNALNLYISTIDTFTYTQIQVTENYQLWQQLPYSDVNRTLKFRAIAALLFKKGNAEGSVDVASNFFQLKQEPNEDGSNHPSHFFKVVDEKFTPFKATYEDPSKPGYVKLSHILHAVIYGGLTKTSANRAGIRDHMTAHPTDARDNPADLKDKVLKAWNDGLYDDTTDQLAAFTVTPTLAKTIKPYVAGDPSKPHCTKCLELVKRIYNNHSSTTCNRKPRHESHSRASSPSRRRPELKANTSTLTDTPPVKELTAKELLAKRQLCYDQIQGGAPVSPGFKKSDCYAFISQHFSDDME